jgi:hypothetical protein
MMRLLRLRAVRRAVLLTVLLLPATPLFAQHDMGAMAGGEGAAPADIQGNLVLNGIEIVTGVAAALVAFQAALAYREGSLGKGMTWVAVGMTVMPVGHLILVVRRVSFDPLAFLGTTGSFIAFSLAVFLSFGASAWGFWTIRKAASR